MTHPDYEILLRYAVEDVTDAEQLRVDTHLAECDACVERIRALRYLQENFTPLWESWTAAEHGRLHRRWQWLGVLQQLAGQSPSLAGRLRQWAEALREGAEITFKLLIDQSRRIASVACGVLPGECESALCPAYRGVGSPEEQKQLEAHLQKSSDCLAEDRTDEAVAELLEAVKIDARRPQSATLEVSRQGRRLLQTAVDGRSGRVWIRYWPAEPRLAPALAVLIPRGREAVPLAAEFKAVPEDTYLLAEFENVPDGPYALRIGPWVTGLEE